MSKQTEINRFMFPPLALNHLGLYQQLIRGIASHKELGNRIIREIKAAHAFRQVDTVRELSRVLINLPIKEYQLIAQYYLVWCQSRERNYRNEVLESVIDQSNLYKSKAIISRAAFDVYQGNTDSALYFYTEAFRLRLTISEYIEASRGVALVKSLEGFKGSALTDLENLTPIIRHAEPLVYCDVLNSLAVELGEAGRKDEARSIIKHVIASPLALAYPEWQETANELKESNRSFVTVPLIQRQPAEPKPVEIPKPVSKPKQSASVLTFPKLKEAPLPEKPERLTPQQYLGLSGKDRREMIFAALKSGAIREDDYYKMMVMLGLLKGGPVDEILDLEDDRVLDDIAVVWSAQIGGEVLVGFLSALRDCDDRSRQGDIIDRLIRKIFHESQTCGVTEDEWRLRFERRLPEK
jgi:hypothetical protein